MTLPAISIITPSFNQAQFLEECILSIIDQKFPFAEHIIIDGQSTDGSVEIIKKYETHIAYWTSEKDSGQSEAINKGLKKATGEIIAWLNSDDLYFPDTLATVAKLFMENPEVDLIYGDVINFSCKEDEYYKVREFDPVDFLSRVSIHQPSVFWRKKLHTEIGYLDESLHYLMDYDLWMRIFFNFKVLKIEKTLSKFRIHHYSKTSNNPPILYIEYRKIFSKFVNSINNKNIVGKLQELGIYFNEKEEFYNINLSILTSGILKKAVDNYIMNCAIQEHSFGSIKKSNYLLKKSIPQYFLKSGYFLIKNHIKLWTKNISTVFKRLVCRILIKKPE